MSPATRMSRAHRAALAAVIALLICSLASPADAATARQRRDAARARRAQVAKELNTLRASDNQLQSALQTLNSQVDAESARAAAAHQAVAAAQTAESQAKARVAVTEQRMTEIRGAVVDRAVVAYVRPKDDLALETTLTPSDVSRRDAFLAQVLGRDEDLLDQLRSAREDLGIEQARAARAKAVAQARRRQVDAKLHALHQARADKARVAVAVAARIHDYEAEAAAQAAQESSLNALILSESGFDGSSSSSGFAWPLRGRVTSGFGYRWGRLHAGIDIAAPTGTPIHASKAGRVIFAGTMNGYGNVVIIDHGGGFSTLYAHQSRLGSSRGQVVSQGQVIGYVGSTGHSTGPHCHFEVRVNGSARNPRPYLP
jgi:murein DD-endopeptidase MepM/ murein hydrolase activator NlpD